MQPFQFVEFVDRRFDSIDFEHFCQNCAVLLFNRADTKNSFIGFCYIPLVSQKDWRISSSRHDGDVFDKLVDSGELNTYIYALFKKKITIRISTWNRVWMVNESVDFPGFVTNCGIFPLLPGESLIFLSTVTSFLRLDTDMSSQILATE